MTDFYSGRGSAAEMTLILTTNTTKNAVKRAHARRDILNSGGRRCLHEYSVISVCGVFVCVCACVNSTCAIALIAHIPLAAFVSQSADEAGGILPLTRRPLF